MPSYAITGSTGAIGGRVAARLAERGLEQRLLVRDAARAPRLDGAQVAEAPGGYADGEGMRRALDGIRTLLLVSGEEAPDRLSQHHSAVDAAAAAGVERIVYTSFVAAAPDTAFTFGRDHFHTEERIRAAGLGHVFLRDSLYLDYMPWFADEAGVIRGPAGDGRLAPVARDDVADVAVAALTDETHDGEALAVTGGELFSLRELAERLSRLSGREVRYVDETIEEARASRAPSGAPDWEIEGWVTSYVALARGEMDVAADTVERLAGHPPKTLEEYVREHPESLRHLQGEGVRSDDRREGVP